MKKKLLIVPTWVKSVLVDNGKSISDVINTSILSTTLSSNDLDIYIGINLKGLGLTSAIQRTFTTGYQALPTGLLDEEGLERILADYQLNYTLDNGDEASLLIGDLDDTPMTSIKFEVHSVGKEYIVLTPTVSDDTVDGNSLNKSLIEELSNELSKPELFKTELMKDYISRL